MILLVLDTIPILAAWPVLVRYRHSVVGNLVGICGTISFGGNSVLKTWRELLFSSKGGLGAFKKGANVLLLREKGVPAQFTILKCTNQVFL
jgi:hypothetical protein